MSGAGLRPTGASLFATVFTLVATFTHISKNHDWGYRRIQGALANLGHECACSTIADILRRHGIEPAPERNRKTTWKEFLKRHWEMIVAADFFTTEVWTSKGLTRYLVLFFIELSTRKVTIAGIASRANGLWMSQVGRHVTDAVDGILNASSQHSSSSCEPTRTPKIDGFAALADTRPPRVRSEVFADRQ